MNADKTNRWTIYTGLVIITGIAYLTVMAHRFIPAVLAVDMGKDIGAGPAMLGALSSAYLYVYGLAQMPYGILIDKIGPRKILALSFIIAGIGGVVFALAPNPFWSIVARAILGFGCAPALIASLALLARWIPKDKFAFYSTLVYIIGGLGPVVAAAPLAFMSAQQGWRGAVLNVAIFTFAYAAIMYLFLRDYPKGEAPLNVPNRTTSINKSWNSGLKIVVRDSRFWLLIIFGFGVPSIYLVYGGLWAGVYIREIYGYSLTMTGEVLSFGGLGSILGFFLGPLMSDKIIKSRNAVLIIFSGLLLAVMLPFVLDIKLPFWLLAGQMLMIGVLSCGTQPVAVLMVKDMFPTSVIGTALGMYNTFPLVGGGIIQVMIGVIINMQQSGANIPAQKEMIYSIGFMPMLIACALGLLAAVAIYRKDHHK